MIKYNDKLDNRHEYYLPLIDILENGKIYSNYKLPLTFYVNKKEIFEEIKNYINLFKKIDIKNYYYKNYFQNSDSYMLAGSIWEEYDSIYEELDWIIKEYEKIDFDSMEFERTVRLIKRILKVLIEVYPHNKHIYEKSLIKFQTIYDEIDKLSSIEYNQNALKYKKVYLPDAWYILPNQILYNAGNGHKVSNLTYDFYYVINDVFEKNNSIKGMSSYYYNLAKEIKEKGFIEGYFKRFINLSYFPVYDDTTHELSTCHEKYTLDHMVGIVMAHAYFYKFFEDIQKYCSNPKEEFDKLKKLTNSLISDICVRCCGFHKVESQLKKTITTSDINYKESFKEYMEKGWNIVFIPPIIIQRELGKISELDMESSFVKKYIKK